MPSSLPDGDPAPDNGLLPGHVQQGATERNFGLYIHIPFCAVRCGYCDFNTYTATELGPGASQDDYAGTAMAELDFAARVLDQSGLPQRPLQTVFFGGGTPTLLPTDDLAALLERADSLWPLARDAEVTTEANPDSVTEASLQRLADAGFTRVSFGMQSAVPHVLKVLDRTHTPERVPEAVRWARNAGLEVSLDLIYGTPGETMDDWEESLSAALSCEPDHVSAYSLIIEDGTKLAAQMRRGEVPPIDDDDHADKYLAAERMMETHGLHWYEVSNWSRTPESACRHNLAYWRGDDWWGIGPGAHSHVGGVRWWNTKHPVPYANRLAAAKSPAAGRETLDASAIHMERVMLRTRLQEGLSVETLSRKGRGQIAALIAEGLIDPASAFQGSIVLTLNGRLLADGVVRRLLDD